MLAAVVSLFVVCAELRARFGRMNAYFRQNRAQNPRSEQKGGQVLRFEVERSS